jgi:hypothetical protein
MTVQWIKPLFIVAGIYDGVLGIVFLLFGGRIFRMSGVTPPNHTGYIQFPALILLVFAAMFFQVAAHPARNRALIPYGAGLKAAYCGVVFWNAIDGGIPSLWMPWAWMDLIFLVSFAIAWNRLSRTR